MTPDIDPEGTRLPIKLDTTSNGEFVPVPLSRANRHANHLAHEQASAKHGYAEITPAVRAKIFGLNGAKVYALSADEVKKYTQRDRIARERLAYRENPQPHYLTYGPKTRRQFLNLLEWSGGPGA